MRHLAERVFRGDRRGVARAVSIAERGGEEAAALADAIWPRTGRARRIGVTGSPGVGKSTLVDALTRGLTPERTVGVLAVDPSSAFTRGALLGDRIRMERSVGDDRVFIRSMATRGRLGGLAPATSEAADILDAAGFDDVVIETVGVGQAEVDVMHAVDVTVVVLAPGAGDSIQALKAGLMEIGDIFCINKADRPGAEGVRGDVEAALELAADARGRRVVSTVAMKSEGLDDLIDAIDGVWRGDEPERGARRRRGVAARVLAGVAETASERARDRLNAATDLLDRVVAREISVPTAARRLLEERT